MKETIQKLKNQNNKKEILINFTSLSIANIIKATI